MDSNSNINEDNNFDFRLNNSNNNIIDELELKWKEIEDITQEKLNKNKESRKLNSLNNFSIMRINLKSLIHPLDDSSDFENYCNLKIKQLDKKLYSIDRDNRYNSELINLSSTNNDLTYNYKNRNIKSFLKQDDDNDSENLLGYIKQKRYSLNEFLEINRNNKNKNKDKIGFKQTLNYTNVNNNNNDDSYKNNKTFNYGSNRNNFINNNDDTYDNKLDKFEKKLNEIKNTFLIRDKHLNINSNDLIHTKEIPKYKKYKAEFKNNDIFNGYNTTKNKTISHKIEENYNYFYSLFPDKKNNDI